MFYRIEYHRFDYRFDGTNYLEESLISAWNGVGYFCTLELRCPKPNQRSKKDEFYFTEKGFDRFGRDIVKRLSKEGILYRIIKVKEKSIDVKYRDKYQVAGKRNDTIRN